MVNQGISHRLTILFLLIGSIVSILILSSNINSVPYSTSNLPIVNPIVGIATSHYLSTINANSENGGMTFTIFELGKSSTLSNPNASDPLFSVNSSPYGIDFKRWAIYYLQKDMSEWYKNFPKNDDKCNYHINGTVKMLANPFDLFEFVNREPIYECNFDTTDSYFFPLFLESCDYYEKNSDPKLNTCVVERNQHAKGQVWLDGVELQNLDRYRLTTDYFKINYTTPNPVNVPEGSYRALLNGLFLFVKPLPPGDHELVYKMIQFPDDPFNKFAASITYKLHISKKG